MTQCGPRQKPLLTGDQFCTSIGGQFWMPIACVGRGTGCNALNLSRDMAAMISQRKFWQNFLCQKIYCQNFLWMIVFLCPSRSWKTLSAFIIIEIAARSESRGNLEAYSLSVSNCTGPQKLEGPKMQAFGLPGAFASAANHRPENFRRSLARGPQAASFCPQSLSAAINCARRWRGRCRLA